MFLVKNPTKVTIIIWKITLELCLCICTKYTRTSKFCKHSKYIKCQGLFVLGLNMIAMIPFFFISLCTVQMQGLSSGRRKCDHGVWQSFWVVWWTLTQARLWRSFRQWKSRRNRKLEGVSQIISVMASPFRLLWCTVLSVR